MSIADTAANAATRSNTTAESQAPGCPYSPESHSEIAEVAVLAGFFANPEMLIVARGGFHLKPDHFYLPHLRNICAGIYDTQDVHDSISVSSVAESLARAGILEESGGRLKLEQIARIEGGDESWFRKQVQEVLQHALNRQSYFDYNYQFSVPDETPVRTGPNRPVAHFGRTQLANADRLVYYFGDDLRYCYGWNKWLVWRGSHWETDELGEVYRRAEQTVRLIEKESAKRRRDAKMAMAEGREDEATTYENEAKELFKHMIGSSKSAELQAMVRLAQHRLSVTSDQMDANHMLLTVANGTIDLSTRKLREHRREDYITNLIPIEHDPFAECPTWETFMSRVQPDEKLRDFLQTAFGVSLTGDVSDEKMIFLHGLGRNGKSTTLTVIEWLLGSYHTRARAETFMLKSFSNPDGSSSSQMAFRGKRLITTSEVTNGVRLDEGLVKDLTGGDKITARNNYDRGMTTFVPTWTIWMAGNYRPLIKGQDDGIWSRIALVEYNVFIPPEERDRNLKAKLRAELPGILNWALDGLAIWKETGLQLPQKVQDDTAKYQAEMDVLGTFFRERCDVGDDCECTAEHIYRVYRNWADNSNLKALDKIVFGRMLSERNFTPGKVQRQRGWKGIQPRPETTGMGTYEEDQGQ